jgi:hypothetical protein
MRKPGGWPGLCASAVSIVNGVSRGGGLANGGGGVGEGNFVVLASPALQPPAGWKRLRRGCFPGICRAFSAGLRWCGGFGEGDVDADFGFFALENSDLDGGMGAGCGWRRRRSPSGMTTKGDDNKRLIAFGDGSSMMSRRMPLNFVVERFKLRAGVGCMAGSSASLRCAQNGGFGVG